MTINQQADLSQRQNFYCKIYVNDIELNPQNIISCTIREWIFDILPRIELIIMDDGVLSEAAVIKDNTIIHLIIGRDINDTELLEIEFIKQDHTIDTVSNKITNIMLTGLLKTTNTFFPVYNKAYRGSTSIDVVRSISSEMGLQFESSENMSTNDSMTWLQINQTNLQMIQHIIKRAYRSNDTMFCYASTNGKLNYKSLVLETNKSDNITAKLNLQKYSENILSEEDNNTIWYNSYDVKNIEGYANKTHANAIELNYIDFDSMQNKKQIISSRGPSFVNDALRSDQGQIIDQINYGFLFTKIRQKNVFNKYYEALVLNDHIKWGFFNQSLMININASKSVKLFDKVNLIVPSLLEDNINEVYSGEYIVGGIIHNISKSNIYRKQLSLHRPGTNRPEYGAT